MAICPTRRRHSFAGGSHRVVYYKKPSSHSLVQMATVPKNTGSGSAVSRPNAARRAMFALACEAVGESSYHSADDRYPSFSYWRGHYTIRAWLSHASLNTTKIYAEVDLEMKAKALVTCEIGGTASFTISMVPMPMSVDHIYDRGGADRVECGLHFGFRVDQTRR
jgi:hypothetical protein